MSVCTARLMLNLRSAAVENSRKHWAFGELELNTLTPARHAESVTFVDPQATSAFLGRLAHKDSHEAAAFTTSGSPLPWEPHAAPTMATIASQTSTLVERGTIMTAYDKEAYRQAKYQMKLYPNRYVG